MNSENDWFFAQFEPVPWSGASEDEKYTIWSMHIYAGGPEVTYPEFCDTMDKLVRELWEAGYAE